MNRRLSAGIDYQRQPQQRFWITGRTYHWAIRRFVVVVDVTKQQFTSLDHVARRRLLCGGRAFNRRLAHAVGKAEVLVTVILSPGCQGERLSYAAGREFSTLLSQCSIQCDFIYSKYQQQNIDSFGFIVAA